MNPLAKLLLIRRLRRQLYGLDAARLAALQARLCAERVRHAVAHSPFFRRHYAGHDLEDFASLPLCDKATMMASFGDYNTAGLDREALLRFAVDSEGRAGMGLYQGRYSVGLSSGTSGNKGLVVLSPDERDRYGCLIAARHGLPPSIRRFRVLFALRINNPSFENLNRFGLRIVYTDYNRPLEEIVAVVNRERLNVLAGPPSFLTLLGREAAHLDHPIDAVVCYAEVLQPETRARLERTFGAPVVEIYQGSEGFVAATCRAGRLHLMEDVLRVEILPLQGGGPGRVVITDMHRSTQPILRYQLNDVLEVGGADCSCGSAFRVVARIHGRMDDVLAFVDGAGQRRWLFPDVASRAVILASDEVEEYQLVQHALDHLEIRLQLRPGADAAGIEAAVARLLGQRLQDAGIDAAHGPRLQFVHRAPEKNAVSGKLIRVQRRFAVAP
jgi:phenylacetate-CoA ligase